ncbi:MAG: hypothetical protein EAY68_06145 [Bacteroidetes bacterium]|nr:MAG: hypothetical protein EAY68_06145 [Bacteroidota bacterium]
MKKIYILVVAFAVLVVYAGCKKGFNAELTYANYPLAATWAKGTPFYSPNPQIFMPATGTWRSFFSFSFTSEAEPDVIGFGNPFVPGRGTNALFMNSLYTSQQLTADSGFYNVTIPKCFRLVPKSVDSTFTGTVEVIPKDVVLTRRNRTTFIIKISAASTPGTYDTRTGLMEVSVKFNEASIGGDTAVIRRYRFTP